MIFGKKSITGVLVALFAISTLPASAAAGFPHFGKKSQDQGQPAHKLTASQTALIDKAIAREKVVIATLKERAPLVETYIQTMKPDDVVGLTLEVRIIGGQVALQPMRSQMCASSAGVSMVGNCPAWRLNNPARRSAPNRLFHRSMKLSLQSSFSRIQAHV